MWEIDLYDQITTFLLSLSLGAVFALVFYFGEAVRVANNISKIRIWINDISYFAVSAIITYCFLLSRSNGEIRGYIIVGIVLGWWLFKIVFSKHFVKFLTIIINSINKILGKISNATGKIILKLYIFLRKTFKKRQFQEKKVEK